MFGWERGWRPCSLFGWKDEDGTRYVVIGDLMGIWLSGGPQVILSTSSPSSSTTDYAIESALTMAWTLPKAPHLPPLPRPTLLPPPWALPLPAMAMAWTSRSFNLGSHSRNPASSRRCQSSTKGCGLLDDRQAMEGAGVVVRPTNGAWVCSNRWIRKVTSSKRLRINGGQRDAAVP